MTSEVADASPMGASRNDEPGRARNADAPLEGRKAPLVAPDVRIAGRRVLLTPHNCFACGQLNDHGMRLELHAGEGRCWTELVLEERFEGWDGMAHGGILAAVLDEVMAWAIIGEDNWGVTARMTIEYRRPAHVGSRIRGEGWLVRSRRRLVDTAARIVDLETGEVLATAEALYVAAPEERKRALKERYAFALLAEDAGADARVDATDRADRPDSVDSGPGAPFR